jgi:hypothetical protein
MRRSTGSAVSIALSATANIRIEANVTLGGQGGGMPAILFSQMEPPPELEDEFNDWYDSEHVPIRLALPDMQAARRYVAVQGSPKYLAIYEAKTFALFDSPGYHAVRKNPSERTRRMLSQVKGFTRYTCEMISDTGPSRDAPLLSVNAFAVPQTMRDQFDDWYETEHIPRLMRAADWLRVRRFVVKEGEGADWTHLALHEIANEAVMNSRERAFARTGPKRDALAGQPWFESSGRWLYRRIRNSQKPT